MKIWELSSNSSQIRYLMRKYPLERYEIILFPSYGLNRCIWKNHWHSLKKKKKKKLKQYSLRKEKRQFFFQYKMFQVSITYKTVKSLNMKSFIQSWLIQKFCIMLLVRVTYMLLFKVCYAYKGRMFTTRDTSVWR